MTPETKPASLQDALGSTIAVLALHRERGGPPIDPGAMSTKSRVANEQSGLSGRICSRLLTDVSAVKSPCALLLGPTGCGKTSAAKWILVPVRAWLQSLQPDGARPRWTHSRSVLMLRARDIASASKRHGLGDGYPPEVTQARQAAALCVDDVGSEGNDVSALQDILDLRYENGLPTIVTSGLSLEQLGAHLGAAYLRRIVDQHVERASGGEYPVIVSQP